MSATADTSMSIRRHQGLIWLVLPILGACGSCGAPGTAPDQLFDLADAFGNGAPIGITESGLWQFGYSASNSLAPEQFQLDAFLDPQAPIRFWHPRTSDQGTSGYYPYVAYNGSANSELEPTHGWAARSRQIAMEGSGLGQYSLVRFTVPSTGTYRIVARFEGIHFRLSSTDVHILLDGAHLFDAAIQGYGGDPAFHAVEGASPTADFRTVVPLQARQMLTFAVGIGDNATNYNDTTGLTAQVTLLGR